MATGLIVPMVGSLISGVKDIIGEFHMSPEDKANLEVKLAGLQAAKEAQAADVEIKLNDIAGQNIRADAVSGDKFTARARPTFMYIIEFILAFNYCALPFLQVFGSKVAPLVMPPDLLVLFGTCVTGYVMARTADKALALPGQSNVNVFGIVKASNSGNVLIPSGKTN